jgi:nitrite reductase/ring-hydroxylating ferredoxin subunit
MKRIQIAKSTDVREGEIFECNADGTGLILTRIAGRTYAVENKCAHLGWSIAKGQVVGSTIQCPWHGSKFDVCSGKNLDWVSSFAGVPMPRWTHRLIALGKQPASIRIFETSEASGVVFVSLPS